MNHTQRKPTRINNYDYSQNGCYFITICTFNREHLFGKIKNESMILGQHGKIAEDELLNISKRIQSVELDRFIVMPNHIHLILNILSGSNSISRTLPGVNRFI